MKDEKKFRLLTILATILTACILSYNIFHEYVMTELAGYLKRRFYYEKVITKKGFTLHKGRHWRKAE